MHTHAVYWFYCSGESILIVLVQWMWSSPRARIVSTSSSAHCPIPSPWRAHRTGRLVITEYFVCSTSWLESLSQREPRATGDIAWLWQIVKIYQAGEEKFWSRCWWDIWGLETLAWGKGLPGSSACLCPVAPGSRPEERPFLLALLEPAVVMGTGESCVHGPALVSSRFTNCAQTGSNRW